MIRVVVVEDHALVRAGLLALLAGQSDFQVVAECGDAASLIATIESGTVADVVLTDLSLPGIADLELINRLRRRWPDLTLFVLSMHDEPGLVRRALNAGVRGYASKGCPPAELIAGLRKVASGGRFVEARIAGELAFFDADDGGHDRALSAREAQVLAMIAEGLSVGEIADRLFLSPKTVSTHKTRLMQKVGANNTVELIRYALQGQAGLDG